MIYWDLPGMISVKIKNDEIINKSGERKQNEIIASLEKYNPKAGTDEKYIGNFGKYKTQFYQS